LKPATRDALSHARIHLEEAIKVLAIGLPSLAARQANIAALTAARVFVFERTDKGPKTHKGVKRLMHQLVHEGASIQASLLDIFDDGFEMKLEADYGDPAKIGQEDASAAIEMATHLIADIERIVDAG
jgi:uncharacterized protein (UPF0332 family)